MPPQGLSSGKEVAESALEALLTEVAAHYTRPGAPLPARAALESLGFQVGLQLVERCVGLRWARFPVGNGAAGALRLPPFPLLCVLSRYARDKPRFGDPLDAVKFICKEFWNEVFSKQVDNLKTNYRVR